MIKTIKTDKAPQAIGPYSQAISYNDDLIFCSGQIGLDPHGNLAQGLENQTRQVLENLKVILEEAGSDLNHVLKATVFLANMADFTKMNEIYSQYFENHKPARATVQVTALPKNALVEIEVVAVRT